MSIHLVYSKQGYSTNGIRRYQKDTVVFKIFNNVHVYYLNKYFWGHWCDSFRLQWSRTISQALYFLTRRPGMEKKIQINLFLSKILKTTIFHEDGHSVGKKSVMYQWSDHEVTLCHNNWIWLHVRRKDLLLLVFSLHTYVGLQIICDVPTRSARNCNEGPVRRK